MSKPTPTRHGNWHIVNGELVDMDQMPTTTETPIAVIPSDADGDDETEAPVVAEESSRRRKSNPKE